MPGCSFSLIDFTRLLNQNRGSANSPTSRYVFVTFAIALTIKPLTEQSA